MTCQCRIIKSKPVVFVVANVGEKLNWVNHEESLKFWQSEVETHVVEEEEFVLDDFHSHYAYVASLWTSKFPLHLILLETHH